MAYIFELDTDLPDEPIVDAFGTEIVEFALGYDVDRDVAIIMSVMLVPGGSYLDDDIEGVYDLRFGIRERNMNHEWNVTAPDYTKESTDEFIPIVHRQAVFGSLCNALELLTNHSEAKHLTMETFYPRLPDKALKKYNEICDFMASCGFVLKDAFRDGTNGKNYWFLSRVD